MPWFLVKAFEPTGCAVAMYSSMIASRMSWQRSVNGFAIMSSAQKTQAG
jgi:hypothetical protein